MESDSDDDLCLPAFLKPGVIIEVEEETTFESVLSFSSPEEEEIAISFLIEVDFHFLKNDPTKFSNFSSTLFSNHQFLSFPSFVRLEFQKTISLIQSILEGNFMDALKNPGYQQLSMTRMISLFTDLLNITSFRSLFFQFIDEGFSNFDRTNRALVCLALGRAYFSLYCQMNYTGPELSISQLDPLLNEAVAPKAHSLSVQGLEVDGELASTFCTIPQALFLSRIIFMSLAEPQRGGWQAGVELTEDGQVKPSVALDQVPPRLDACLSNLPSRHWYSARACVVHLRLLLSQTHSSLPSLWLEAKDSFHRALQTYGGDEEEQTSNGYRWDRELATLVHLEWGLCQHHFQFEDKGKVSFSRAVSRAGLSVGLTGALGKKVKHQQKDCAQLVIQASSTLLKEGPQPEAISSESLGFGAVRLPRETGAEAAMKEVEKGEGGTPQPETQGGWQHSDWELGRRLLGEVEVGGGKVEEAAVREVLLDSMDGGAVENNILERTKFLDPLAASQVQGGSLHTIDQALLLALCLDVSNHNPADGLTNEEMSPYIERVLSSAQNWMVHSTALLQRSWIEFERRKTADRALLQIQALLDQHSTRLTLTQSTRRAVEESAPAWERLRLLPSLSYPAQYELKRDLAHRYQQMQVFQSALNLFRELEIWDEVVKCYQLMDKPHRAELLVRERLQASGPTPYMLTALGDLTGQTEHYERAWELSGRRFARAKRTLGRICFDKGDFQSCSSHLREALSVQPLIAHAWYLLGVSGMRLGEWEDSIRAFLRCVQQDEELVEAWANIGAIHMRLGRHSEAFGALEEAYKGKRESWKVVENLISVTISLGKWKECARFTEDLMNLKMKALRNNPTLSQAFVLPVSLPQLRTLVKGAVEASLFGSIEATPTQQKAQEEEEVTLTLTEDSETGLGIPQPLKVHTHRSTSSIDNLQSREERLAQAVSALSAIEALLRKLTSSLPSHPLLWDVQARFLSSLGREKEALEARVKEFRALLSSPGSLSDLEGHDYDPARPPPPSSLSPIPWERLEEGRERVCEAAQRLVLSHLSLLSPPDHSAPSVGFSEMYTCLSLLKTAERRISAFKEEIGPRPSLSPSSSSSYDLEGSLLSLASLVGQLESALPAPSK